MNAKQISPAANAIQRRVLKVIDDLIRTKRMGSLSSWCEGHDLNRVKYSNLRSSYMTGSSSAKYKIIDVDVLTYLVQDFGVSASWLIPGSGNEYT
jgi:hypothetical protein